MKLCITAQGATLDSPIEERLGRAPYFIIIESDTETFEAVKNPFADNASGVGPKVAQLLVSRDVKALISGQVGGNAREALVAAGIAMYTYPDGGSVKDAFDKFKDSTLVRSG